MRCPRCGNENSEQNRFCGMCGATLLSAPSAAPAQPQHVPAAAPSPSAEAVAARPEPPPPPRAAAPVREATPAISGPSFLGLNDPPPASERKRARLSIDPHSTSGSNLDYLLDDEEQPRHWGPGKILLILIALALAIGFGYLRWKNQGLALLNPPKKPSAAAQSSATPDANAPSPSPRITEEPQASPPAQHSSQPAADSGTPASGTPAGSPPAATPMSPPAPSSDASKPTETATATPPDKTTPAPADASSDTAAAPVEKPKPMPKDAAPKPPAAKPVVDPVAQAQKYLYGRGASQDCDRGMRLLKPAADQGNSKAMIEMGALYSAGLCTPHDLPTAYRWFALALRKDPDNTAVQTDLQKLWGEMTQPERQLAIRMSQ